MARIYPNREPTERQKKREDILFAARLGEEVTVRGAKRKATARAKEREFEATERAKARGGELQREFVRGGRKPPPTTAAAGAPPKRAQYLRRKGARQQTLAKFRGYQAQQEGIAREKRREKFKAGEKPRMLRPSLQLRRGGPTVDFAIPEFGAKPTAETLAQGARLRQEAGQARREFDIRTGRQALERAASARAEAEPVTRGLPPGRAKLATPQMSAEGLRDVQRATEALVSHRVQPAAPTSTPQPTGAGAPMGAQGPAGVPGAPVTGPAQVPPPAYLMGTPAMPQLPITPAEQAATAARSLAGGLWQGVSRPYETAAGLIPTPTPPQPGALPPTMPSGVPPTQAPWLADRPPAREALGPEWLRRGVQAAGRGLWQGVSQPYQTAASLVPQATPPPGYVPPAPSVAGPMAPSPTVTPPPAVGAPTIPLTPDQIQSILTSPNPAAAIQLLTPAQVQQLVQMAEGQLFVPTAPQAPSAFLPAAGEQPMQRPDLFAPRGPAAGVAGQPFAEPTWEQRQRIEEAKARQAALGAQAIATKTATQVMTGQIAPVEVLTAALRDAAAFDITFDPDYITSPADASGAGSRIQNLLTTPGLTPEQKRNVASNIKSSAGFAKIRRAIERISTGLSTRFDITTDAGRAEAQQARMSLLRARDLVNQSIPGPLYENQPEAR